MFHIAFIIPTIDRIAGAESQVLAAARGLRKRGWRISLIALSGSDAGIHEQLMNDGIGYASLRMRKGPFDPRGWLKLHAWTMQQRPDIIHAHLPHAVWMARWSRLFAPVRVMVDSIHTSHTGSSIRRVAYRTSAMLSNLSIAVSEASAQIWCTTKMVTPETMTVLPNGIDTQLWNANQSTRQRARSDLQLGQRFVWFTAGRMAPVKNHAALIEAMASLPEMASLHIAGDGPLRTDLEHHARTLNLENRIHFLGHSSNVRAWMRAADAFVLPSLWEGLPTVLLEAGACSLPSVATDFAGCRDVLIPGKTGLLAQSPRPDDLVVAMLALMNLNSIERHKMGQLAREHIETHFELEAVLDRWEHLYSDLLSRHPTPSRHAISDS